MTATSPQGFYCPTCNKNIISPYNINKCPDCGTEVMRVKYIITEDEHSGKYEVKVNMIGTECIGCGKTINLGYMRSALVPRLCEECKEAIEFAKKLMNGQT